MGEPGRKPRVEDSQIVAVLRKAGDPMLTTAEVAEELPIGERASYERLNALADADEIKSRKVGRARVWWHESRVKPPDGG